MAASSAPVTRLTPIVSARPSATPMNTNTMGSRPVFQKGTLLQ